jgi:hypothetical protein
MTKTDLKLEYQKETGEMAPDRYQQDEYDRDYIAWLEDKVIQLTEPVVVWGEPLRKLKNNQNP